MLYAVNAKHFIRANVIRAANSQINVALTGSVITSATGVVGTTGGTLVASDLTTFSAVGSGTAILPFAHNIRAGSNSERSNGRNHGHQQHSGCERQCEHSLDPRGWSARHVAVAGQLTAGTTYKIRSGTLASGTNLTVAGLISAFSEIAQSR